MKAVALLAAVMSQDIEAFMNRKCDAIYRARTNDLCHDFIDAFSAFGLPLGSAVRLQPTAGAFAIILTGSAYAQAEVKVESWLRNATLVRPEKLESPFFEIHPGDMMHARLNLDDVVEAMKVAASYKSRTAPEHMRIEGMTRDVWRNLLRALGTHTVSAKGRASDDAQHIATQG